jgi:pimeloyl-ACP methyl ester carboxylesterase
MNLEFVTAGDIRIAVWDSPGTGTPLLFAHATGFHGRMWDHIIRKFPGRRALALEFRGHGRSSQIALPVGWSTFAQDLILVADRYALRGAVGVGHSMGGHALAEAVALRPDIFSALVLADPVIFPSSYYGAAGPDVSFIERRRNRWSSPAEMFERFRPRLPFSAWPEDFVRTYCEYALLPDGDGFVLACSPEVEASIYRQSNAKETDIGPLLSSIKCPATILRAGKTWQPGIFDPSASPTSPDAAERFGNGHEVLLPDHNHFIPMEAPDVLVREIRAVMDRTVR